MKRLLLKGWRQDVHPRPVSLVDAFRQELGTGLAEAKKLLEQFVESGSLVVVTDSSEAAQRLQRKAEEAGVLCELTD